MKKQLLVLVAISCTIASMQSCAVSSAARMDAEAAVKPINETNAECFVEMKDGSIRHFKSLKLVTGIFSSPHLLADGKEKIGSNDIKAYQNTQHYAISQQSFKENTRSKSAVETLPGFAVRIAKGKLNIYCKKYFNGTGTAEQLFVQEADGEIVAFTPDLMNTLLKDHPQASEFFQTSKRMTPVSKRLQATVALMNQSMLSKN
jgi:hypothetical protein